MTTLDPFNPPSDNPSDSLSHYQAVYLPPKRRRSLPVGCSAALLAGLILILLYLFFPMRTNLLVLGIDRAPGNTAYSRSDTIILMTFDPLRPYVGMLSIPRDLWVQIPVPGVGENRINTAHFYAELNQPGSGPRAAQRTIEDDFGVKAPYYIRVKFGGVISVIDAMGGVDIHLDAPAAGLAAGDHHLDGVQTLAFVRSRAGADDFFRMAHGQLLLKAAWARLAAPSGWKYLPWVFFALSKVVDTNLPPWVLPRMGIALLRVGPGGIDNRTLTREMVAPFTTSGGAMVLRPVWEKINPLVREMFGR